ncbi:glycoside hydrolase family 18 protein, partial [Conidiobolus coronatus NRRL 28638]
MQPDGNFVLYNSNDFPLWSSKTNGKGSTPYCLALFGYGHLTLYDSGCTDLWHVGSEIKQNPDGSCVTHDVRDGDNCKDRTYGFKGCGPDLQQGKICVSPGRPPAPDLQKDAQGNTVKCGFGASGNGTFVRCPLNICCSKSGFCNTTDDYCRVEDPNANPGVNSCQGDCGNTYSPVGPTPSDFKKIGYYESWNKEWKCLHMSMASVQNAVDKRKYTHVHYAFVGIREGFQPYYKENSFIDFINLHGVKKIASFGGWAFSTDSETSGVFVHATKPENRGNFINNLINFANKYGLDGLDFDWEYPSAPDIPGLKGVATPEDGANYLAFLRELKSKYKGSISIAAPASFWYLQAFPIKEIAEIVDYIVYMTYDLHGQWDAGNDKNSGHDSALKSHVHWGETKDALTMVITKAGAESRKIMLGLGLYGRSFQPADINCWTPDCKFTGTREQSNASPGRCTGTSGYISNAEISEIVSGKFSGTSIVMGPRYDQESDSYILTYTVNENPNWVSYMDNDIMNKRTSLARDLGLGGTVEWAMDL